MPRRDDDGLVVLVVGDTEVASWPLTTWGGAGDLSTVDALARLHVVARRLGGSVRLCHPSEELLRLIDLVGLRDVLGTPG